MTIVRCPPEGSLDPRPVGVGYGVTGRYRDGQALRLLRVCTHPCGMVQPVFLAPPTPDRQDAYATLAGAPIRTLPALTVA